MYHVTLLTSLKDTNERTLEMIRRLFADNLMQFASKKMCDAKNSSEIDSGFVTAAAFDFELLLHLYIYFFTNVTN